jgi:hypothetical protein
MGDSRGAWAGRLQTCPYVSEYISSHRRELIAVAGWFAVFALLLPVAGPIIDHHFAERLPGHGHVYMNGPELLHEHDLSSSHNHTATMVLAVDDTGPSVVPMPAPSWGTKLVISLDQSVNDKLDAFNTRILRLRAPDDRGAAQADVTPDPRPPRA